MKPLCILSLLLALLALGCEDEQTDSSAKSSNEAKASVTVPITVGAVTRGTAAFGTNPLVVSVGSIVTWVNQDNVAHTITSDTGIWDSGILRPDHSFSRVFDTRGVFPYHCTPHGAALMSGAVQVQ